MNLKDVNTFFLSYKHMLPPSGKECNSSIVPRFVVEYIFKIHLSDVIHIDNLSDKRNQNIESLNRDRSKLISFSGWR